MRIILLYTDVPYVRRWQAVVAVSGRVNKDAHELARPGMICDPGFFVPEDGEKTQWEFNYVSYELMRGMRLPVKYIQVPRDFRWPSPEEAASTGGGDSAATWPWVSAVQCDECARKVPPPPLPPAPHTRIPPPPYTHTHTHCTAHPHVGTRSPILTLTAAVGARLAASIRAGHRPVCE